MRGVVLISTAMLALAGCEASPPPDGTPVAGQPNLVHVTPPPDEGSNPQVYGARRITVDGTGYLAQLRSVDVTPPARPLIDDDPTDDIVPVDDLMIHHRTDLAVSRRDTPFTQADGAKAQRVALAYCESLGFQTAAPTDRLPPRFIEIKAQGDSNEWLFPGWCQIKTEGLAW